MKYIRLKTGELIIFSQNFDHDWMAKAISAIEKISSAGFVSMHENRHLSCHGRSLSLGIASIPNDTQELLLQLNIE